MPDTEGRSCVVQGGSVSQPGRVLLNDLPGVAGRDSFKENHYRLGFF